VERRRDPDPSALHNRGRPAQTGDRGLPGDVLPDLAVIFPGEREALLGGMALAAGTAELGPVLAVDRRDRGQKEGQEPSGLYAHRATSVSPGQVRSSGEDGEGGVAVPEGAAGATVRHFSRVDGSPKRFQVRRRSWSSTAALAPMVASPMMRPLPSKRSLMRAW